jgi:hypothetical protein
MQRSWIEDGMKPGSWKPNQANDGAMSALLAGCVLIAVVLGSLEIMTIVHIFAEGPVVGDMVTFRSTGVGIDQDPLKVAFAAAPVERTCVLNPQVMRADGGSLVVEAREPKASTPLYRVHWAGEHTAKGAEDCGGQANLVLSANDLRALASATGELAPDGRIQARF